VSLAEQTTNQIAPHLPQTNHANVHYSTHFDELDGTLTAIEPKVFGCNWGYVRFNAQCHGLDIERIKTFSRETADECVPRVYLNCEYCNF
jgi:hypothetical protein